MELVRFLPRVLRRDKSEASSAHWRRVLEDIERRRGKAEEKLAKLREDHETTAASAAGGDDAAREQLQGSLEAIEEAERALRALESARAGAERNLRAAESHEASERDAAQRASLESLGASRQAKAKRIEELLGDVAKLKAESDAEAEAILDLVGHRGPDDVLIRTSREDRFAVAVRQAGLLRGHVFAGLDDHSASTRPGLAEAEGRAHAFTLATLEQKQERRRAA